MKRIVVLSSKCTTAVQSMYGTQLPTGPAYEYFSDQPYPMAHDFSNIDVLVVDLYDFYFKKDGSTSILRKPRPNFELIKQSNPKLLIVGQTTEPLHIAKCIKEFLKFDFMFLETEDGPTVWEVIHSLFEVQAKMQPINQFCLIEGLTTLAAGFTVLIDTGCITELTHFINVNSITRTQVNKLQIQDSLKKLYRFAGAFQNISEGIQQTFREMFPNPDLFMPVSDGVHIRTSIMDVQQGYLQ